MPDRHGGSGDLADWTTVLVTAGLLMVAGYVIGAFFRVPFLIAASAAMLTAAVAIGIEQQLSWGPLLARVVIMLSGLHAGYLFAVSRSAGTDD